VSWWGFAALLVIAALVAIDTYRSEQRGPNSLSKVKYEDEHDMRH
jgi:hypothetical protein